MARIPEIKIKLEVIETDELKKAIAEEMEKVNKRAKADIDSAIDKVLNKYIGKVDEEN